MQRSEQTPAPGVPVLADLLQPADREKLHKRARAKYFSFALAKELATCESELQRSYLRTLTCSNKLTRTGDKITAQYCGNRWCLVCCRIRTAKMINKYEPHLEQMCQPHFVTLTIPNISADVKELKYCIQQLQLFCRRMFDKLRKQGIKYKGFRKIEITYNPNTATFHPHIHFLLDGGINDSADAQALAKVFSVWKKSKLPVAKFQRQLERYNKGLITPGYLKCELLRQYWLQEFPTARAVAQDIRPATAGTLKELFKYTAKIVSKARGEKTCSIQQHEFICRNGEVKTVLKKKYVTESALHIYVQALDKIYCAMYGKRVLQPVGYTRQEAAAFNEILEGAINEDLQAQELDGLDENVNMCFEWHGNDWREIATGHRLTGWQPTDKDIGAAQSFVWDSG